MVTIISLFSFMSLLFYHVQMCFQVRLDAYKYTTQVRRPLAQKVYLLLFFIVFLTLNPDYPPLFSILFQQGAKHRSLGNLIFSSPSSFSYSFLFSIFFFHLYPLLILPHFLIIKQVQSIGAWAGILQAIVYFAIIANVSFTSHLYDLNK